MNRISASTWAEIRTAYASGIGLRQIARNIGIPAGTVLARSKREGWTQQIATAKLIQRPELARELAKPDAIDAITPMQSAALSVEERKQGLFSKALRIADKAASRIETQIDSANISQATIAFGVSTEKALLLAGEPTARVEIDITPQDIHRELQELHDEIVRSIEREQPATTPLLEAQVVETMPAAGEALDRSAAAPASD